MIPPKPLDASWTDEQWQAIYQDGNNIIVSAGAGSGKTAVLTERIIEKLKQGISISSLIVLTFTKAAAFEMRTRVRNKLKKEVGKGNKQLQKELDMLDQASITTFDSYSLSLVRKYHYLLGIDPDIMIADNIVLKKKKKEILDNVFADFYAEDNLSFLELLDTFTTKDDDKVKEICNSLNEALNTLAHKKEYLDTYLDTYYQKELFVKRIGEYECLLHQKKNQLQQALFQLEKNAFHPISKEFVENVKQSLKNLTASRQYDEYRVSISMLKLPSFTRSKKIGEEETLELKKYYEEVKEVVEEIKELCCYESADSMIQSIENTKKTVAILIEIIKKYDEKLFQYKKKNNQYEFFDISRLAIELLEQHPEICETLKKNINEIMIDEYQDTNDIGDYFISLISNHNVYMVGDIKQSIYRFRNANPSIFMEKYNQYAEHNHGEKIDLNKNFRSRREVLDDINFIFEKIMDEEIGGADYQKGHAMVFGNHKYEKEGKTEQNYHLEILDYAYKKTEWSKKYRSEEIEAFLIASDIKKKVENHYQVFDKDKNILRDICYQDFSILLDRKTSFDLYKKIFTYLGIPLTIHKDEAFAYSDEIFVIQNIMKWIFSILDFEYAKKHLRYAVASISRSIIGKISDEDLFLLLMDHKEDLLETMKQTDCVVFPLHQKMTTLAEYSKTHTLSQLLEKVYEEFDLYHAILSLQNIELLNIKLNYLLDVTRNLEKLGYQVFDFIVYLETAQEGNIDITFSMNQNTNQNSVNLMTIHKSKGLEYYICYYAGLGRKFSKADLREKFLFDQKLGLIVPVFENGIRETFYKELMKDRYQKEDIAERLRVFYVALTRAKEKMILVTNLFDAETNEKSYGLVVDATIRSRYQSFYDILVSIKEDLKYYITPVSLEEIPLSKNYEQWKETNFQETLMKSTLPIPYIECAIQKEKIEEKHFSGSYSFIDSSEQEKMNLGLKLHECLEYIDYHNIESSLSAMNLSDFEKRKLKAFFEQPFLKKLKNPKFYQELEFLNKNDTIEQHGIIDLLIVDEDCAYVIDYKLKNIDKDSYIAQIKGYQKVVESKLNIPVKGILYSIFDEVYKEIK